MTIPQFKEVTIKKQLHYYRVTYTPCVDGQYGNEYHYLFKTVKRQSQISQADVTKACHINKGDWDCIWWNEISMEEYLRDLPEV